jgi:DNA-binding SARP family transcriptional activator
MVSILRDHAHPSPGRKTPTTRVDVLGPVRVHGPEGSVVIGGRAERCLMALLAAYRGRPVDTAHLTERVWGGEGSERTTAPLRRAVRGLARATAAAGVGLLGDGTWFSLDAPPGSTDLDVFRRSVATGRRLGARGHHERSVVVLEQALDLWADTSPFLGPDTDAWPEAAQLREERLNAIEDHAGALVAVGRPDEAVERLARVALVHPLRESLAALRIRALARRGDEAHAVDVYEQTRQRLAENLGLDPGRELEQEMARVRGPRSAASCTPPA